MQAITRTFRQGLTLLVSSYFSKLLFAVATFLIVRHFDVATYGVYATAFTFASFFAVFLNFGINDLMVRQVSTDRGLGPIYMGNNILISLGVAVVVYLVMLTSGRFLVGTPRAYALVFVLGLAVIFQSLHQIFWSFLQVNLRIDLAGLGQAFFAVFWVSSVLVVVFFDMKLHHLVILQLATAVLGLCVYIAISASMLKLRFKRDLIPEMLRQVYPFGLSNLLAFVYIQSDIFLVSRLQGEYQAGLYAAVFRLLLLVLVVPEMIYKTVLPRLYAITDQDQAQARQVYRHGIVLMLLVMAPFACIYFLWPEALITLVLGERYVAAAPVLRIFSGIIIIQALIHPTGQQLVALGRQHLRYKLQLAVTVVFLIAALIVIPRFGIQGAAMVNSGVRLLLLILFVTALIREGFTLSGNRDYIVVAVVYAGIGLFGYSLLRSGASLFTAIPLLLAITGALLYGLRKRIEAMRMLAGE